MEQCKTGKKAAKMQCLSKQVQKENKVVEIKERNKCNGVTGGRVKDNYYI